MNRTKIETKDKDGNPLVLYAERPKVNVFKDAQLASSRAFRRALNNGAMFKAELNRYMEERDLWNDDKQKQLDKLDKEIEESLLKLKAGGIQLSEARRLAIRVRELRLTRSFLLLERNQLDEFTAESQSDNERFDYLVAHSIFKEDGSLYFSGLEDYQNRAGEAASIDAAASLSSLLYGISKDWEKDLPENKFLLKYNFVNEDLRLVDKEGHLVDLEFRRLNDSLQRVNEEGKPINEEGQLVDEYGLLELESQPFLDEEGNPVG